MLLKIQAISYDLMGFFWPYPVSQPFEPTELSGSGSVWGRVGKKLSKMPICPAKCLKTKHDSQKMRTLCQAILMKIHVLQGI